MEKKSALDIANLFVGLSNSLPDSSIDNLKLNKLCYYAQGWALAKLGEPLFDEDIQAWNYGPVIPSVYHTYKVCGKNPIGQARDVFDENKLPAEELQILIDVYVTYGKYTSYELVQMTHRQDGPWDQVYQEKQNRIITKDSMRKYFSESSELNSFVPHVTEQNTIDYTRLDNAAV